ncbi:MAG: type II toxin-antitoxin system HicB family antitoxin [Candidatus Mariimomonas ferrooxydans]
MSYKVSIVIEKDEYGYYAYAPDLEGCQTQGETIDEVMANIKEATSKEILTTTLEVQVA